jgi:RHS repeat-associated protein
VVTPSYDTASRLTGLKVNAVDYASQITYNAASQTTSVLIGSGTNQLTETYSFDERSQLLTGQSVKRGGTTLIDYSYGYKQGYCDTPNAVCFASAASESYTGQLTLVVNNGPTDGGKRQTFEYDDLGRLKKAQQYAWIQHVTQTNPNEASFEWEQRIYWQQTYSYDRYGNRTAVAASNSTGLPVAQDGYPSLTFDAASNRTTSPGFTYDRAGNQLQNNTGQSFIYDAAGRLVTVKNLAGTTLASYTYGATNRRLITQTGSESSTDKTYYIWEGNSVIAEYVEQTSATMPKWSKNFIYLGERLLATETPNGTGEIVRYHHPDRLGTRLVTNNLDTTSFSQENLPFGTVLTAESSEASNRRFTSYERSVTTGLDYAINRQYDSRQGRFTQPDPLRMAAATLADPQSLNMYSYVGNDPVNRVDPDGQFWGALFKFIIGLFKSAKPNVITGSFTYHNAPPVSVSFTPNFQNIGVGFAGLGFALRANGQWLPAVLGSRESLDPQQNLSPEQRASNRAAQLLQDKNDCYNFISELIGTTGTLTAVQLFGSPPTPDFRPLASITLGMQPSYAPDDALHAYNAALSQGRVTASGNSGAHGDYITYGTTTGFRTIVWNTQFFGLGLDDQALQTLHESLHLFENFTDIAVAEAAHILATRNRTSPGTRGSFSTQDAASVYINEQIAAHCRP